MWELLQGEGWWEQSDEKESEGTSLARIRSKGSEGQEESFIESEIPGSWTQGFWMVVKTLLLGSTGPAQPALTASWNLQIALRGSVRQETFPFGDSRKQTQRDH